MVYIPGLGSGVVDQLVDAISRRICCALSRYAAAEKSRFVLQEGQDEDYAEGRRTRLRTVVRHDSTRDAPIVDIYELKYGDTLTRRLDESSPLAQIVSLARVVVGDVARLASSFRRKGKSLPQKLQLGLLSLIMFLVAAYGVVLLGGTLGAATQLWSAASEASGDTAKPSAPTVADAQTITDSPVAMQPAAAAGAHGENSATGHNEAAPAPTSNDSSLPAFADLPDLALADLFLMVGLRAHTSYLGDPEGSSISCFDLLVPHLFEV